MNNECKQCILLLEEIEKLLEQIKHLEQRVERMTLFYKNKLKEKVK